MYSKKKPNTLVLQSLQFKQSNCQFPSNLHLNAQYNSHAKLSISSAGLSQSVCVGGGEKGSSWTFGYPLVWGISAVQLSSVTYFPDFPQTNGDIHFSAEKPRNIFTSKAPRRWGDLEKQDQDQNAQG